MQGANNIVLILFGITLINYIIFLYGNNCSTKKGYRYFSKAIKNNKTIKGTLTRHKTTSPGTLIHRLKPFRIWLRIRADNRQSWLHSGVIDTVVTPLCNQLLFEDLRE
jgi:hypothetical protein